MNPKVDFYFAKDQKWQQEVQELRVIALDCGLSEELKWGVPCYTFQKSNIVLIHDFKEYCAFLFFKGALLKDPQNILVQQTKNVQAARQVRFRNIREIIDLRTALKAYIQQAIEFQAKLEQIPDLKTAFDALTPGRQKSYILYFSSGIQGRKVPASNSYGKGTR
eukprot:gene15662-18894_t